MPLELWAVNGDTNSHGGGGLIAGNPNTVFVNNIAVIAHPDDANADSICPIPPVHCNPKTTNGSSTVFVYNEPVHRNNDGRACGAKTTVTLQQTVFVGD